MEQKQELSLEYAVLQLQEDVVGLGQDVETLKRQVQGGEDPTKGMIVLVADLTKAIGNLTTLVADLQKEQHDHGKQPHLSAREATPQGTFQRWVYGVSQSVGASVATLLVLAFVGWAVLGLRVTLQSPLR
jgi:hypothetical protein